MDTTNKRKWQVRLAALVIFLLGSTAGVLGLNGYRRWVGNDAEASRGNRFEAMLDRLQLSADQKTQVHQILADTRSQLQAIRKESEPRVEEVRKQTNERLQKVLTPEQWKQFQQEREGLRRGRRGRGRP